MKIIAELEKVDKEEFRDLLINDENNYLPSIVDKFYHRGTLTSNAAEAVFSTLKRECNYTKQPLLTLLEVLMNISERWLKESLSYRMKDFSPLLMNLADKNAGSIVLEYLESEMNAKVKSRKPCECQFETHRLPCIHKIVNNFNEIYNIPKEYFFNEEIFVEERNGNNCTVEERDIELKNPNVYQLLKRLKLYKESKEVWDEITRIVLEFLEKRNDMFVTHRISHPYCPVRISKNCDKFLKKKDKNKIEKKPKKQYTLVYQYY